MSVRAYIVRTKYIYVNEKEGTFKNNFENDLIKYCHTDEEFCFNIWHQTDLFDLIRKYGSDYTNNDSCGTLEISHERFLDLLNENNFSNNKRNGNYESILLMKKYFEETNNEFLIFNCY